MPAGFVPGIPPFFSFLMTSLSDTIFDVVVSTTLLNVDVAA